MGIIKSESDFRNNDSTNESKILTIDSVAN